MVQDEIKMMQVNKSKSNHTIWQGIKKLESNKQIVVWPEDKEGGVVILTKDYYNKEIHRLLEDTATYKPLRADPTAKLKLELTAWVKKGNTNNILDSKEAKYLIPQAPRIPVLYIVPKIHKNKETPPGRPIISSIGSLYSRLGEYLDIYLQPLVIKGRSYLKDSRELIKSLQSVKINEHTILVTVDIESLYTNIKQSDALLAVKVALMEESGLNTLQINFLVEGLQLN